MGHWRRTGGAEDGALGRDRDDREEECCPAECCRSRHWPKWVAGVILHFRVPVVPAHRTSSEAGP